VSETNVLVNLFAAVLVALLMGYLASRLRLPPIAGYLIAGVLVGPYTPGFRSDMEVVRSLADIGVAFLMFAVGTQVNLGHLRRVQRVGVLGGILAVVVATALGALVAKTLGASWSSGLFFGALLALSSTAVAVKILTDRGELETLHGRIALSVLLVQDFLVVPLVLVLPVLSDPSGAALGSVMLALGKAALLLGGSVLIGIRLLPRLLDRVADTGSRELMLFATISIALGAALGTQELGISAAVGAFIGGLIVSQTQLSRQVSAIFSPLRDLFSIFFFISVGMVLDFKLLREAPAQTAITILLVVVGKAVVVFLVTRLFGYGRRISLMVAVTLAQVGEFSFILAGVGLTNGLIDDHLYSVVVSAALVSIFLNPFLIDLAGRSIEWVRRRARLAQFFAERPGDMPAVEGHDELAGHAIVAGYGRVGRELVEALTQEGIAVVVIDHDPAAIRDLGRNKVRHVYGDAADREALRTAGLGRARLLAFTIPDPAAVRGLLRMADRANSDLQVIVRVHHAEEMTAIGHLGVQFVHPEFEAGLHFVRHALELYGLNPEESAERLNVRRAQHYQV